MQFDFWFFASQLSRTDDCLLTNRHRSADHQFKNWDRSEDHQFKNWDSSLRTGTGPRTTTLRTETGPWITPLRSIVLHYTFKYEPDPVLIRTQTHLMYLFDKRTYFLSYFLTVLCMYSVFLFCILCQMSYSLVKISIRSSLNVLLK